jgi:hypothetical protein
VHDAFAVSGFTKKPCDGGSVLAQFVAQHLHGNRAVVGVLRAEDGGRSALSDFALERISGDVLSDEAFFWHAANLTAVHECGKQEEFSNRRGRIARRPKDDHSHKTAGSSLGAAPRFS